MVSDIELDKIVMKVFDLRPQAIIKDLDLLNTTYQPLATYGHFGRNPDEYAWERCDRVESIRSFAGCSEAVLLNIEE